uniref:Lipase_3 domain-containing protein n=1 Tax=Macrostomum lignano TaxID=282301 RepID=A0A1I8FSK2_9PLAT
IFYIFMHGLGIVCIVYLNTLISCHQHHRAADFTPEEAPPEARRNSSSRRPEAIAGTAASTSSGSKFFMPEDRDSVDEQLPDGHFTATTLCARSGCVGDRDGIAADSGQPKVDADAVQIELAGQAAPTRSSTRSPGRSARRRRARGVDGAGRVRGERFEQRPPPSPTPAEEAVEDLEVAANDGRKSWKHPVKKITWSAVGVNLYLRLGAIYIRFGVMVHDGFKIADVLLERQVAKKALVRFVFRSPDRHEPVHLGQDGGLRDIKTACHGRYLEEDSPSYQLGGPTCTPARLSTASSALAICYKFFSRVGDLDIVPIRQEGATAGPEIDHLSQVAQGACSWGLMIMILRAVPMISLILLQMKKQTEYKDVYILAVILTECSVLCFTTGMALAGIVKAIRNLRLYKVRGNETFDVNLLFVGLAGIVCYNLFVAISVGACLMDTKEGEHCNWGDKPTVSSPCWRWRQSVLQTLFIMQAIQRKVTMKLIEGMHKPGRGVTIALLIANLAMWVASVFEAQRNIAENFLLTYFGDMPWKIIKYIFLPLIIFFRFHSTVCLSEIWIQSYKPQKGHQHRHQSRCVIRRGQVYD